MLRCVTSLIVCAALAVATYATPQRYATASTTIRVGIVVLDASHPNGFTAGRSAAPHAWYNLDRATALKPAGWSFSNPHAPSTVSQSEYNRWSEISGGLNLPTVGDPITKSDSAYWEVFLDSIGDVNLGDYDVLLVNPSNYVSLNPSERERLRRFVDQGGVLWIDPGRLPSGVAGIDQVNNLPSPFILASGAATGSLLNDFTQPVLSTPYALTGNDLSLINTDPAGSITAILAPINLALEGASALSPYFGSVYSDFFTAQPFSYVGTGLTGSVTRIGDGFVVVTSRGASLKLNRTANSSSFDANGGFYANQTNGTPSLGPDGIAAAKLAINIASLATEYRQAQGGSRKSNSVGTSLRAPLLSRFQDIKIVPNAGVQPVLYKGVIVMAVNDQIRVYNANPGHTVAGDSSADLGVPDLSNGSGFDLIWSSKHYGSTLSTPVCAEIPNAADGIINKVFFVDSLGSLHALDLFKKDTNGHLVGDDGTRTDVSGFPITAPGGAATPTAGGVPNAPTIHEGTIYVADSQNQNGNQQGRVWIVDAFAGKALSTSGNPWSVGGSISQTGLGDLSGSPLVAYIPILDNSGGIDKVIYIPFRPQGGQPCGFISLWAGARGERPIQTQVSGTQLLVSTRASDQGGLPIYLPTGADPRGVKLTILDPKGNPESASWMKDYFDGTVSDDGQGTLRFNFVNQAQATAFDQQLMTNSYGVRVDYTIDWGRSSGFGSDLTARVLRGSISFPDYSASPSREVLGNLAISPAGTLFAVVASPTNKIDGLATVAGGSLFAFREEGRGSFRCTNRWEVYPKHTMTLNQSTPVSYDEVLFDKDPNNVYTEVGQTWPSNDMRMSQFALRSGPSVRNGQVFVTAVAAKTLNLGGGVRIPNVPVSILLTFSAEPPTPEIRIGQFPAGSSLVQPDFGRSNPADPTLPDPLTILQQTDVSFDSDSGTIRIPNLMNTTRGPILNCLSLSQPVILKRPGLGDVLIDPNSNGGQWSPLNWYETFEGSTVYPGASPVVAGNTVYTPLASSLPNILNAGNPFSPVGVLAATDASISPTDTFLQSLDPVSANTAPYRSWQKQLWGSQVTPAGAIDYTRPDPHQLWPQAAGVRSFNDFQIRLNQSTMPNSNFNYGISVGDGSLVAYGTNGLYVYNRSDIVVCDDGRVARFDPAGNPVFTSSAFLNSGDTGLNAATNAKPLVRPTRAYALGENDLLVVDTGANRVVKVQTTGQETRSIESFIVDPLHIPDGYTPNESGGQGETEHLKAPSDVLTYSEYVALGATPTFTNQQTVEYWVHYLIADSGNHRLVELVDRYGVDAATNQVSAPIVSNGVAQVGVLLWHSPAQFSGKGFKYNSVNRVFIPSVGATAGRYIYVAGTDNAEVSGTGSSSPANGNGGVVIFDSNAPTIGQVFDSASGLPDTSNVKFWNTLTNAWDTGTFLSSKHTDANGNAVTHPFTNVQSVTARLIQSGGAARLSIMVTDSTGIYEVLYDPSISTSAQTTPTVRSLPLKWMLPNDVYRFMRRTGELGVPNATNPSRLRATYAKRLDNGDILLVNGFTGTLMGGGAFSGEVIELSDNSALAGGSGYSPTATNLGFNTVSIQYVLPPVQTIRGLVAPTFADRR